ncbi:glutamate--cysteine ligase [Brevibacterium luteolum]|uniref:glutamate--cysteine ligase n=1 Tax=Brevibacterium luteolum TaxID=199591 RepID=UPI00223BEE7C|nr:glutamate--cysteine ligase [Brevibacterium luteolum]MCT1922260.1 glutamate--cysteine ligase [Brevibacterium luteolum]
MGDDVSRQRYSPEQRTTYREQLNADLETFDSYLQEAEFSSQGTIGLELELNLVDADMQPAKVNHKVLESIDHPDFQSEIGAYNIELNHPVLTVQGDGLKQLQDGVQSRLDMAHAAAAEHGAKVAMIGTLPTLTTEFLEDPSWVTDENRYRALSNAVIDMRGELVRIEIHDREYYRHDFTDVAPESSCTSMQLHLQVPPNRFATAWNASQAMAAAQVALSANAPLFAGYKLWHENRIPVFTQSIDTRTPELVTQGVRPRVWFGERWITSVFDLFEENVRYFPPMLPESREESGTPVMLGSSPALHYLNLHNGTVWRWNRPIYAADGDLAHVRLENRLLPAGPTVTDLVADAAFYYGVVKYMGEENRPVWSRLSFPDAEKNFFAAARSGLYSRILWPKLGRVDVADLIRTTLVPQARKGLQMLDVDATIIDEYMDIIEARARTRQNGATWQLRTLMALKPRLTEPDTTERRDALKRLLELYIRHQSTGAPVHTWPVGDQ